LPALRNSRHEAFCQLTFEGSKYGWSQGTCYMKAGFRSAGHGAETNASRLLKKDDIRRRLAELGEGGAKKARVTAESLIAERRGTLSAGGHHDVALGAAEPDLPLVGVRVDERAVHEHLVLVAAVARGQTEDLLEPPRRRLH